MNYNNANTTVPTIAQPEAFAARVQEALTAYAANPLSAGVVINELARALTEAASTAYVAAMKIAVQKIRQDAVAVHFDIDWTDDCGFTADLTSVELTDGSHIRFSTLTESVEVEEDVYESLDSAFKEFIYDLDQRDYEDGEIRF